MSFERSLFAKNKSIILLHAGNKSTQKKDIKIIKERLIFLKERIVYEN